MNPLEPNSMIQSRYLIVQMISEGPSGDMYLAVDQRVGSAVALKRVSAGGGGNEMAAIFERDAMVLTRLNHPVLPKVKDYFTDSEGYFLVVEHISGDDLAKRMERAQKPFPLNWVMFWADQMLDALTYLHSHVPAIVHGTVRPYNLKLSDDNHIILLDCGTSTAFRTPGSPAVDVAADIASLSATLYQLLTSLGIPEAGGVVPLSQLNGSVPFAISEVIMKGMASDGSVHFSSAAEMQKELRRAASGGLTVPGAQTEVMSRPVVTGSYPPEAAAQSTATPTEVLPRQSELKTEVFARQDLDQQAKTEVMPLPVVTNKAAEIPVTQGELVSQVEPVSHNEPVSQVTQLSQPQKVSSSRALVIAGICAGLLLSAVVAAGGGWYLYNSYYAAGPAGTPEPLLEAAESSSPEPVAVADLESNVNSSSDPTPLEDVYGAAANSNKAVAAKEPPRVAATPQAPARPVTKSPPPKQQPTPKTADKPPPRDERTVILQ